MNGKTLSAIKSIIGQFHQRFIRLGGRNRITDSGSRRARSKRILRYKKMNESLLKRWLIALIIPGLFFLIESYILLSPIPAKNLTGSVDSWRIYSKDGRLLREAVNKEGLRARWVTMDQISPLVVDATIASEDERFYSHSGIDWIAMVRAVFQNVSAGDSVSGASTITMQLSRLMYDLPHSTAGKLAQMITALRIERSAGKRTILLSYLNRSPYGAGTIGIQAASYRYFGKPNTMMSLAEAALIAGLPNSPSKYNPLENPDLAKKRQRFVLSKMLETGKISEKDYRMAIAEQIVFYSSTDKPGAMHFCDYVMSQNPPPGDVYTTLDYDLNTEVEGIVRAHVTTLAAGGMTNAAVVILDNNTGAIISMVGSVDYRDGKNGAVNGAVSLRQPGSALKPFAYGLAFSKGYTPLTIIPDIETTYVDRKGNMYSPVNYTDKYYGPVLLAEALGRSLNVPAIRLVNDIGLEVFLRTLKAAGFESLNKDCDYYGLGLTLGNGEVTLLELAQAYALFPRHGISCKAEAIYSRIGTFHGTSVFSKEVCFLVTDILSNEILRMRAFGAVNPLLLDFPVAVKTGTSSNWRDNWVVGYTDAVTIAIWAGDFTGSPMNQVSGAIGAGPLFNKIATLVKKRLALTTGAPEVPQGVERIIVCKLSGDTPTEYCTDYASYYVLKEKEKRPLCNVHRKVRVDKRNGLLASSTCPAKFAEEKVYVYLEPGYSEWQAKNGYYIAPTDSSPFCVSDTVIVNKLNITCPKKDDIYIIEPGYDLSMQTLQFKGEATPSVPEIDWILDNRFIAKSKWPYMTTWQLSKGKHTLYMKSETKRSDTVTFEVR